MPFIITTVRPPLGPDHSHSGNVIERRAVLTVDEARDAAAAVVNEFRYEGGPHTSPMVEPYECDGSDFEDIITRRGGNLGRVSHDGTTVEVRHVQYQTLADLSGVPYRCPGSDEDRAAAVATFNAKQVAR